LGVLKIGVRAAPAEPANDERLAKASNSTPNFKC